MVRTELYINGANGTDGYLSFPFGVNIPVSINFNLADVRNPEQRKASRSQTINLLGTNEVNKLFENLFEVNVVTQYFNKNLKTPVRYLVDGLENFTGDMQLIKINIKPDNSIVYECSIIGEGGSLFVDIGEKLIVGNTDSNEDLDFSDYDHNYTRANQIGSRTTYLGTGTGYAYPFVDRGTNGGSGTVWNVKDFLPCFSIYEYVKKIIENTGRTFTSTFLESSFFKHLYCYPNMVTIPLTAAQLSDRQLYVGTNTDEVLVSQPYYVNNTYPNETLAQGFFDNGNQNYGGTIVVANNGEYNVAASNHIKLNFTHTNPLVVKASISNFHGLIIRKSADSGVSWFNIAVPATILSFVPNNGTNYFNKNTDYFQNFETATGPYPLSVGDYLGAVSYFTLNNVTYYDLSNNVITSGTGTVTFTKLSGSGKTSLYMLATSKDVSESDFMYVKNTLPTKIKQKEFLTSIFKAFNLFVEPNPNNENDLIIEPFDEFYNTTDVIDYENRTDLAKDQTINPNLLEGKRYIYSYKEDKDYYNDLYKKTYNEVFGTEQIDVDNDFIKSDKKTELIFSATPLVANYDLGIAMPQIYTLDGVTKKTIAANIRLIYCDVKTSPNPYTYRQSGLTDLVTNEYLHGGMEDDAMNPTVSLMFGPAKEFYYSYINAYFTSNTLYNAYHKQYVANLIDKDGKFVTKYLWLTPKDINQFSFRNRLFIDGAYYIVNKIENYTPLDQTSTKVELIKLLKSEVFVPEQFLISDSPINAGNGVPTARLNSSLNIGTNIQNRGTNCLAVGDNIVIPESCNNLIVFGSNITADENSTGLLLGYKSYIALISQTGTDAPTAIVLNNTLGDVTFAYFSTGVYKIESINDLFTLDKTFLNIANSNTISRTGLTGLVVNSYNTSGTLTNGLLNKTSIEIRVYN
ncbi:hypothetical protein UFOVP1393_1 [uncultured Caudovirales phage]|uniref:Uncharacterized protein n=1 Tax=uncultured Caudovirales phage TaxID=2100421 RepID=A0A6J5S5N8_9CAUD|nr:hypothetical protein UFOVP1393_1 [uncultured Caudovirales phage]